MSRAPPEGCLTIDAARRPYLRDRPIPMPNSNVTAGSTVFSVRKMAKLPAPTSANYHCSASHPPGLRRGEQPADVASAMGARMGPTDTACSRLANLSVLLGQQCRSVADVV